MVFFCWKPIYIDLSGVRKWTVELVVIFFLEMMFMTSQKTSVTGFWQCVFWFMALSVGKLLGNEMDCYLRIFVEH